VRANLYGAGQRPAAPLRLVPEADRGERARMIETCRSCGETFELTEQHKAWFARLGLLLPRNCRDCRRERHDALDRDPELREWLMIRRFRQAARANIRGRAA
jgi:hypothetical protein